MLNFSKNLIRDNDIRELAAVLQNPLQALMELCLAGNLIKDDGVKYLADALQNNTVRIIDGSYLCIYILTTILIQTLTKLDLKKNYITTVGENYLAKALETNTVHFFRGHEPIRMSYFLI